MTIEEEKETPSDAALNSLFPTSQMVETKESNLDLMKIVELKQQNTF